MFWHALRLWQLADKDAAKRKERLLLFPIQEPGMSETEKGGMLETKKSVTANGENDDLTDAEMEVGDLQSDV